MLTAFPRISILILFCFALCTIQGFPFGSKRFGSSKGGLFERSSSDEIITGREFLSTFLNSRSLSDRFFSFKTISSSSSQSPSSEFTEKFVFENTSLEPKEEEESARADKIKPYYNNEEIKTSKEIIEDYETKSAGDSQESFSAVTDDYLSLTSAAAEDPTTFALDYGRELAQNDADSPSTTVIYESKNIQEENSDKKYNPKNEELKLNFDEISEKGSDSSLRNGFNSESDLSKFEIVSVKISKSVAKSFNPRFRIRDGSEFKSSVDEFLNIATSTPSTAEISESTKLLLTTEEKPIQSAVNRHDFSVEESQPRSIRFGKFAHLINPLTSFDLSTSSNNYKQITETTTANRIIPSQFVNFEKQFPTTKRSLVESERNYHLDLSRYSGNIFPKTLHPSFTLNQQNSSFSAPKFNYFSGQNLSWQRKVPAVQQQKVKEQIYPQPEQNYEIDEEINVRTNGRAHGVQPINKDKVGYVVEGQNYKKYRVEQRTSDGFIVGEYGVVNHDDGSLRGVRYTADEEASPSLIHQALVKFLAL